MRFVSSNLIFEEIEKSHICNNFFRNHSIKLLVSSLLIGWSKILYYFFFTCMNIVAFAFLESLNLYRSHVF